MDSSPQKVADSCKIKIHTSRACIVFVCGTIGPSFETHQCLLVGLQVCGRIRPPTLALKPRGDITRSPKQGHQWPHKKDPCPPKIFKKDSHFSASFTPKPCAQIKIPKKSKDELLVAYKLSAIYMGWNLSTGGDPGFCQGRRPYVSNVAKQSCMSKVAYLYM